ncbi:MAG: VOC family protein [Gammaproteobacteria bacterium]|nr:VOC family protein [Gammaproteobacteria bacterium]
MNADPDRLARGLRGHLNRFSHTVINVSDLDRALAFYEATFPVRRVCRIDGPAQAYPGLGIAHGRCRGWVLESRAHVRPPGALVAEFPARHLHLVEWLQPRPLGRPYAEANHVGIYRQNSLVSDLDQAYRTVLDHGGRPYGEPSWITLSPDGFGVRVFAFRDPDGSTLEMIEAQAPAGGAYAGMMHHCNLNVRELALSYRFYREVIGLDLAYYLAPAAPQPPGNGALGDLLRRPDGTVHDGDMNFAATLLSLRSDTRSPIDVLQWTLPGPYGEPYAEAHHLGISRVAFEVDDITAAHARLRACGHAPVGEIETWNMGEAGQRRVVIFKDPDGIWLELVEQPAYAGERPPFDP